MTMNEEDIEFLKESCLNDLFQDCPPGPESQTSSACQIQISEVFSLASPPHLDNNFNFNPTVQSSEEIDNSKQFDSEAILQNLPVGNSNVSSTTTEVSSKEKDSRSSIKNDDGHPVQLEAGSKKREQQADPDSVTAEVDKAEESPSVQQADVVSSKEDDTKTKPGEGDVDSTKTVSELVDLPDSTCSPPSPPPAPVFKTDLSQFFSKSPPRVVPLASQVGQNVIAVGEVEAVEQQQTEVNWEVRPEAVRRDPVVPVKRKRGRPVGSKNKKKSLQARSLSTQCKRCFFLRSNRRSDSGLLVCEDCGNIIGDQVIPGVIHAVPADEIQVSPAVSEPLHFPIFVAGTEIVVEGDKIIEVTSPRGHKIVKLNVLDDKPCDDPPEEPSQQLSDPLTGLDVSGGVREPLTEEMEMSVPSDKQTDTTHPSDMTGRGLVMTKDRNEVCCPIEPTDSLNTIHQKILQVQSRADSQTPQLGLDITPEVETHQTKVTSPVKVQGAVSQEKRSLDLSPGEAEGVSSKETRRMSDSGEMSGLSRQRIKVKPDHELLMSCFRCGSSSSSGPWHKHKKKEESFLCHLCFSHFSHLTSSYQEEFDELESVTLSHPGDRIGDAGLEDEENIQTDWSKIYKVENKVDSEISAARPSALKRRSLNKNNKVTFMDSPEQTSQKKTVLVELNPAALLLETRLEPPLVEEEMEEEVKEMRPDSPMRGNDSSERELSEDMESDEFNVEKVKSKWLEM